MNYLTFFILAFLSSFITFSLQKKVKMCAVRASTLSTLVLSICLYLLSLVVSIEINFFLKTIFAGSFIGMCSPQKFKEIHLLFISLFFTLIFFGVYSKLYYDGGALGFLVFVSVSLFSFLKLVYKKSGATFEDDLT